MSTEVFQMVEKMNQRQLDTQLALQCAPVLTGVKQSNLLIVSAEIQDQVQGMFLRSHIACRMICHTSERVTFLIYNPKKLEQYLKKSEVEKLLQLLGYEAYETEHVIEEFSCRYSQYCRNKKEYAFPHEMGLLLGYPVADVIGFMQDGGKNAIYSGYWQVYENLQQALYTFQLYNQMKEQVIRMVAQGVTISTIMRMEKEKYRI